MKDQKILLMIALTFFLVSCSGGKIDKVTPEQVTILTDGSLGEPAQFGLQRFLSVLDQKGFPYTQKESEEDDSRLILLLGTLSGSEKIASLLDQKKLDRIVEQVPIRRLIEPEEVASLIVELYRNEGCAGEVFDIHGGLRLGSMG